ncbi:slit homolog 1 protein-like [Lethenteron reissneri]|uniref:slit homolog 1 protein-like n=1 Tax=Lethenteron reissneri TaxID=7753 RepID=UPI002AB62F76|nr:slit homolog 1 protein-like [Lethenteron reissneri]
MDCAKTSLQVLPSRIPTNIKNIHMENNLLDNVDGHLETHEKLLYLNLSQNRLSHFPKGLPGSLKVIDMSNNQISQIDSTAGAADLKSIEELYLDNNLLTKIPSGLFNRRSKLRLITLHGNPWACDCSLLYLQNWLGSHPGVVLDEPVCIEPPDFSGVKLLSIPAWQLCSPLAQNAKLPDNSGPTMRFLRSIYDMRITANGTNAPSTPSTPVVPTTNQQAGPLTAGEIAAIVLGILGLLAIALIAVLFLAARNGIAF